MTEPTTDIGRHIYALGVIALAIICLVCADFVLGQPVPKHLPARSALAYVAGVFMLLSAAAIEFRRTVAWGAAALTAYYTLIVVILMYGRLLLTHYSEYGTYSGIAEQLSIAIGAFIIYANSANISAARAAQQLRIGRLAFAVCALLFGGAHFVYMYLTAPLVPKWLPPSQLFWGYATGAAFLAAGIALLTGIQARLAAILLTVMLASFAVLVHTPMLIAAPHSRMNWTESAINLTVTGASWIVADSLSRQRSSAIR